MKTPRSIPPIARAFGALVIAFACVAFGIQAAIGASNKQLGKTKDTPSPQCPERDGGSKQDACLVTGQVTGYQRSADGEKGLFKVPSDGEIVAWSVDLSKPSKSERKTFGEASQTNDHGKAPTAGISIIRSKEGKEFKLKSSSPVLNMRGYYGDKPVLTLNQPLPVRKGDIVALTTFTWLPAFSARGSASDTWVARAQGEELRNTRRAQRPRGNRVVLLP